jgi:hypothetical protein
MTRNGRSDPMPYRWPLRTGGRPDALPAGDIVVSDPLADIARLIDDAHRALSSEDLAGLLVAVRALTAPLAEGRPSPRPADRLGRGRPGLTSAARVYLRPISVWLHLSSRRSGPAQAPALVSLGARLDHYLDEVAARPKGCAVPR